MAEIPLGEREDQRLEFKAKEALKDLFSIGREVVGMLNAEGGEVWIGIREEDGRLVSDPIRDPGAARQSLRDYLADSVEPALVEEARVEIEALTAAGPRTGPGQGLLRVVVQPNMEKKPYAVVKQGGRHFVIRVAVQLRPMSREEITRAVIEGQRDRGGPTPTNAALEQVLKERAVVLNEGNRLLWLRLEPAPPIEVNIHDARIEKLLREPAATGNREAGWNFAEPEWRPRIEQGWIVTRGADAGEQPRRLRVSSKGGIEFRASLELLRWMGEPKEIWPLKLLEYPVSVLRLAGKLYELQLPADGFVVGDLALVDVEGWGLAPAWAAGALGSGLRRPFQASRDFSLLQPRVFRGREVCEEPDRCAFRLVREVYEAFGYHEDAMPPEFDRKAGRLVLPE